MKLYAHTHYAPLLKMLLFKSLTKTWWEGSHKSNKKQTFAPEMPGEPGVPGVPSKPLQKKKASVNFIIK